MPKKQAKQENSTLANEVAGVLLIALGVILALGVYTSSQVLLAVWFRQVAFGLFGIGGYGVPVVAVAGGILAIAARRRKVTVTKGIMGVLAVLSVLSFIHLIYLPLLQLEQSYFSYLGQCYELGSTWATGGGLVGGLLGYPVGILLGQAGGMVLFAALFIVSLMIITRFSIRRASENLGDFLADTQERYEESRKVRKTHQIEQEGRRVEQVYREAFSYEKGKKVPKGRLYIDEVAPVDAPVEDVHLMEEEMGDEAFLPIEEPPMEEEEELELAKIFTQEKPNKPTAPKRQVKSNPDVVAPIREEEPIPEDTPEEEELEVPATSPPPMQKEQVYRKPPVSLLEPSKAGNGKGGREETRTKAQLLEQTLKSFSISAKVINVSRGPVVTRYELQPAPGVKVSKIVNLADDIALNLAAPGIRIEAPIPGKAAIGVEVPNGETSMVCARDLIDTPEFKNNKSVIAFALGKDISGKNVFADLAKMPHLLIAGATGSGKSVCVNTFIISVLFHATPEEVQMIMIDPKVVELSVFNGIPHLKIPVVTDPKKAAGALNWAVNEMINRYKDFAEKGVKDIERYNAMQREAGEPILPKLVVVIDELADLMMVSANDVEDAICRIAQLGRASGIHLVIATQRPSVDVITGLIKANVPSRIAFAVSSQVDSRTILDMAGAEKLLGRGDMLYYPTGASKPTRLQGCFITDKEVEGVTSFLKERTTAQYDEKLAEEVEKSARGGGKDGAADDDDELLPRAIQLALEYEQISISMVQRRLRVGYARAARLVDQMEQKQYIGPAEGSKPRQVLITWEEYHQIYGDGEGE